MSFWRCRNRHPDRVGRRIYYKSRSEEDKILFGPFGLAAGEAARINVYAIGNPEVIGNPDEAPWTFIVRVFNRQGVVVQGGKFQVAPGAIGSFEFLGAAEERTAASVLPVRRTLRVEVVGIQPPPDGDSPPPDPDRPGKYAATMEVYNLLSGRTSILLGGPDTLPAATVVPSPQ